MASVLLKNVDKSYDSDTLAVNDANLKIKDGEFVVLVGPSGCGKSTLLRMIAGLEEITKGEIKISDKVVNDVSPKDRNIAMVFQNYALYPHMSVFDNMAFGLKIRKYNSNEIEKRVNEAAELLGLSSYLARKPKALSGGQRQRVAVGRAIVRKPKVFLFDEPLSNLDAKLRVQMRIEINKMHRNVGTTMIYVTHDQVEAMTMGDRIVVMKDGIIQQVDTPLNLYSHPQNKFVAGFIGSPAMNFFKGKFEMNGTMSFKSDSFSLELPDTFRNQAQISDANTGAILGIRPEHLQLSTEKTNIQAKVELIETMGSETYIYLKMAQDTLTMRHPGSCELQPEQTVYLNTDLNNIHFFNTQTEYRIN